jgi:ParB family chromosome partitioning protein
LTQEAVAERVGKNRATVANALRLLQLPPEARDQLAGGAISEGHARAILACTAPADRHRLLDAILDQGLSVRQAEELARRYRDAEPPVTSPDSTSGPTPDWVGIQHSRGADDGARRGISPDVAAIEDRFRQALGTKVQLYRGRRGGKLVVHFYSDDELQGLYETICGRDE